MNEAQAEELRARVRAWIEQDPDAEARAELEALLSAGELSELSERFAGPLRFGTAGLRGVIGAGETRMNRAVVTRASHGLGKALLARDAGNAARGVVIGYDGRRGSRVFAEDTAAVLLALGFQVRLSTGTCPTPLLAFAVTHFEAAAGVMVTASHNPPQYNGYKVYADNGAQIIPPWDSEISDAIDASPGAAETPRGELEAARSAGTLTEFGAEIDELYLQAIEGLCKPAASQPGRGELSMVYTPLHGVGKALLTQAFARAGFSQLHVVAEQAEPDGEFPTVNFPNPEEPGALDLALALAKETKAELILANDPDADRLACVVRAPDGRYVPLSGNEIGILLGSYTLRREPTPGLALSGAGPKLLLASIVSSPQLGAFARANGAEYAETLTGFKWIANDALAAEAERGAQFVFGFEEAIGFTVGTVVRDKDGIGAALVLAELATGLRAEGKTLLDQLESLARETGLYVSGQHSQVFPGQEGKATMAKIMGSLREAPPQELAGIAVDALRDYQRGVRTTSGGASEPLTLPVSDVLVFELASGDRIIARPSGTEPKIKFYFDVCEPIADDESTSEAARGRATARMGRLKDAFVALAET